MDPNSYPRTPRPAKHQNQVTNALRERIQSGFYQSGEWLPAERVLTGDLNVHRKVVRTAIAQLEAEGLLVRQPNCRPVVRAEGASADASETASGGPLPASRLVALSMWRGGDGGQVGTAQQRIFWGMNQALTQAGYHGVFLDLGVDVGPEAENAVREALHLRYALDHQFGGFIFYSYAYHDNLDLIQEVSRRMPLVLIDRVVSGVEADFAGPENHQAIFDATKHLVEQGHRRIAYLTKSESINTVQDRLQGYVSAIHETFGRDAREIILTASSAGYGAELVFDAVFGLPEGERPTAMLCVNDCEAARAASRLGSLGLAVPEDVSLIGFDNVTRTLPNGVELTTIGQPFERIGEAAAKLFLRRAEDPNVKRSHVEVPTELIMRESVRPPRRPSQ